MYFKFNLFLQTSIDVVENKLNFMEFPNILKTTYLYIYIPGSFF